MSKYLFNDPQDLAGAFRALSNQNRLQIFTRLAACCSSEDEAFAPDCTGPCMSDLVSDLGLAPSTVSHHVRELHHSGMICMAGRGQTVRCWVDPDVLQRLAKIFTRVCCRKAYPL